MKCRLFMVHPFPHDWILVSGTWSESSSDEGVIVDARGFRRDRRLVGGPPTSASWDFCASDRPARSSPAQAGLDARPARFLIEACQSAKVFSIVLVVALDAGGRRRAGRPSLSSSTWQAAQSVSASAMTSLASVSALERPAAVEGLLEGVATAAVLLRVLVMAGGAGGFRGDELAVLLGVGVAGRAGEILDGDVVLVGETQAEDAAR